MLRDLHDFRHAAHVFEVSRKKQIWTMAPELEIERNERVVKMMIYEMKCGNWISEKRAGATKRVLHSVQFIGD